MSSVGVSVSPYAAGVIGCVREISSVYKRYSTQVHVIAPVHMCDIYSIEGVCVLPK